MKKKSFNQWALWFALLMVLTAIGAMITGNHKITGISLILMCIALSYGVQSFQSTKGLMLTMWIFAAVCVAMFFPQYFIVWGKGENAFVLETRLITPLLQVIMFGMGAQMSLNDFKGVFKTPIAVSLGVIGRYTVGTLLALAIVKIFTFDPLIAAGIILVACVPSGLATNVMSFLANANVPLSITMSAIATMLAPFITPFLMKIAGGAFIDVNVWGMMFSIFKMVIIPIIAGFIFNLFNQKKERVKTKVMQMCSFFVIILLAGIIGLATPGKFNYLQETVNFLIVFMLLPAVAGYLLSLKYKGEQTLIKNVLAKLSQIGIVTIVLVITAAGQQYLLEAGILLLIVIIIHNILGYIFGYCLAWAFKLSERDRRTIAIEVGMPNAGLASGLAPTIGAIGQVGLAPAIYGPVMNILGSTLASIWKSNPPKDRKKTNVEK